MGSQSIKSLRLIGLLSWCLLGCESFLEVALPKAIVDGKTVYKDDETATAAVIGIYHEFIASGQFASGSTGSVTFLSGLSSDELVLTNTDPLFTPFNENELTPLNLVNTNIWSSCYKSIYAANAVLEGIQNSGSLTPAVSAQLKGEALFIRAFCHFYLVNLYGEVPLIRTTDYRLNQDAPRDEIAEVYAGMVNDLLEAKQLLASDYVTIERVRPNKAAAAAMLARVYLYMEEWTNAETQASIVITNALYDLENDLNNTFLANSDEAIFQLINPLLKTSTSEGALFVPAPNSAPGQVMLADTLVKSFELNDKRRANWVGSYAGASVAYYPLKYKKRLSASSVTKEYSMVLRLAEQYLIRAEARARNGKLVGSNSAQSDLNEIRSRAGLPVTAAVTEAELLLAIEQERKVELFAEWGHRWLDLKRTNHADAALNSKPFWEPTDVLYPIPESELLNNPNLNPQNDGY